MDTIPQPKSPVLQHLSADGAGPTERRPAVSSDPAYGAAKQQYRDVLMRELFCEDIKEELLDAIKSIESIRPPVVSLGFEFWRRHHPDLIVDLAPIIIDAWCSVVRELEAKRDRSLQDFERKILPVIPHPADTAPWIERATAALNKGVPQRIQVYDFPPPPLTPEDFLKPYAFDENDRMVVLKRMYPVILRSGSGIGFECGAGWLQLIDGFSRWLEPIAVELKEAGVRRVPIVVQVKEKFGRLQIYVQGIPAEFRDEAIARKQEVLEASGSTCEACGQPGTLHNINDDGRVLGWVHVYCDPCESEYQRGLS